MPSLWWLIAMIMMVLAGAKEPDPAWQVLDAALALACWVRFILGFKRRE